MAKQRAFGRVFRPDERDREYRVRVKKTKRQSRSWRHKAALDQGVTNSCVGHAITGFLTSSPVRNVALDAFGLYELAKHKDEWRGENYEGTSVRGGMEVLLTLGLIDRYEWAFSIDEVVNTVLELGPMVVGTDWLESMDEPDEYGKLTVEGDSYGGHAYLLYGVDLRKEEFKLLNSWGPRWGRNGTARMKIEDFETLLDADGEACIAREVKVK